MNLKLNNEVRRTSFCMMQRRKSSYLIKEERRRTGRYIAILVGISLFLLAIYHAWVRRIPIVASLVVPALIMFVYVGWVLYTASRDKHRLMDYEAAMQAAQDEDDDILEVPSCRSSQHNMSVVSSKTNSKHGTPEPHTHSEDHTNSISNNNLTSVMLVCDQGKGNVSLIKPIILINDKPEDHDQKWKQILELASQDVKFKGFTNRTKFKRKFCRSKRNAIFKRSYSIA